MLKSSPKAIVKSGSYKGKSNKLGGGGRFQQLADQLKKEGYTSNAAGAIAASVGRKKYGKKRYQKLASNGK